MEFLQSLSWPRKITFVVAFVVVAIAAINYYHVFGSPLKPATKPSLSSDVIVPSIVEGELVLPKIISSDSSLASVANSLNLKANSANLFAIMDQNQTKLMAIRILGEMENSGRQVVTDFSSVVRFYDADNKVIGQKVAQKSTGWDFFGIEPGDSSVYDISVENPPQAEKLEIAFNVLSSSVSASFRPLKITSRAMEIKSATYQQEASASAGQVPQAVEYYTVTGSIVNIFDNPVSEISVYTWVKDKENKIYAYNKQDFKNDLVNPGDKIDFRITLLPLKSGETMENYELRAWGREYRLSNNF